MGRPWECFFAPLAHNWAWEDGERRKYVCAYLHVWHWWYNIKVIYVYNFFPILCPGVLLPSLPTVVHCFSDKLGTAWVPEMVAAVHFRIVLLYWCKFTPCSHFVCCCHHCRSLTDCCLYANHLILLEYCFSTYCVGMHTPPLNLRIFLTFLNVRSQERNRDRVIYACDFNSQILCTRVATYGFGTDAHVI